MHSYVGVPACNKEPTNVAVSTDLIRIREARVQISARELAIATVFVT